MKRGAKPPAPAEVKQPPIQSMLISKLTPAAYNPRRDLQPGDGEYEKLRESLTRWGLVQPIVWNKRSGNVVGGHQRLKVLMEHGVKRTEVVVVDLAPSDEMALNVALNKIGNEWDIPKLMASLKTLDGAQFPTTLTGFDAGELANLLGGTWEPPKVEGNLEGFQHGGPAGHQLIFSDDEWVTVRATMERVRNEQDQAEMTDAAVIVLVCQAYKRPSRR